MDGKKVNEANLNSSFANAAEKEYKEYNIEFLFPEVCTLYGDVGTILYLEQCKSFLSKKYNIMLNIIYTSLDDDISFLKRDDISFVYIGAFSEKYRDRIIAKLKEHKDEIIAKIDKGQHILATGNAFDIFAKNIILDRRYIQNNFLTSSNNPKTLDYYGVDIIDGKYIRDEDLEKIPDEYIVEGLGIYNICVVEEMLLRHNTYTLGKYSDTYVVGFKNTFTQGYELDERIPDDNKFLKVVRGSGICDEADFDGIIINNFIATYLLGPFMIMNPKITKMIFKKIFAVDEIYLEKELMDAYNIRLEEFKDSEKRIGKWR